MQKKIWIGFIFVVLVLGCRFTVPQETAEPNIEELVSTQVAEQLATKIAGENNNQNAQSTEAQPTETSAPTAEPQQPTITAVIEPTATMPAGRVSCVAEQSGVVVHFDPALTDQTVILNALNQGISFANLNQQLNDQGRAADLLTAVQLDFNEDNYLDAAVAVTEGDPTVFPPTANIYVYFCNNREYAFTQAIFPPEENMKARILYAQDLDNRGGDELLIGMEICGASTCFDTFEIWSWSNPGGFWNRMIGQSNDLPFPDVFLRDPNNDLIYDIEVQYGAGGSIGAGPGRGVVRTWGYDSGAQTWHVVSRVNQPSSYRIHVIHDGDEATTMGLYDDARNYYLHVITDDPPLDDWMDPPREKENLKAYAYYRLVVLYRISGNTAQSDSWLSDIQADFPVGSIGHAYAELANVFAAGFDAGGIADGCQAAALFGNANSFEILDPLGTETYGYGNKEYEPTHLCP